MKMMEVIRYRKGGVVTYNLWPIQLTLTCEENWELMLCIYVFPVLFIIDLIGLFGFLMILMKV